MSGVRSTAAERSVKTRLIRPSEASKFMAQPCVRQAKTPPRWYGALCRTLGLPKEFGSGQLAQLLAGTLSKACSVQPYRGAYCAWVQFPMPDWLESVCSPDADRLRIASHAASAKEAMFHVEREYAQGMVPPRLFRKTVPGSRTSSIAFLAFEGFDASTGASWCNFLVPLVTHSDGSPNGFMTLDPEKWTCHSAELAEYAAFVGFAVVRSVGLGPAYGVAAASARVN